MTSNKPRVAIIGATGFIGSHFTQALLRQGLSVLAVGRCFDMLSEQTSQLSHLKCDVSENIDELIQNLEDIDIVYYFAWAGYPSLSEENTLKDYQKNLKPLLTLLPHLRGKKFIFSSSGGTVYGENVSGVPSKETDPTAPISVYGIHKLLAEDYIIHFAKVYDYKYIIARISNPYGKTDHIKKEQGLIDVLIANAKNGSETTIWGDGNQVRDYIHISDACNMLGYFVKDQYENEIFNVASGIPRSIKDVIDELEVCCDYNINVKYKPVEERYFDVKFNCLDNSKIFLMNGDNKYHLKKIGD